MLISRKTKALYNITKSKTLRTKYRFFFSYKNFCETFFFLWGGFEFGSRLGMK